jgi:hypothetical protein
VALLDDFGLLQPYADDDCIAVYTLCLPVDDGVHCCISQSHAARFYPAINRACQYITHLKNRLIGSYIALHKYTFKVNKS